MNGTAKIAGAQDKSNLRIPGFAQLQRLGKSLMLPIAVLPAAGADKSGDVRRVEEERRLEEEGQLLLGLGDQLDQDLDEYTRHGRGTKGMIAIQTSERNGKVVAAQLVEEDDQIMLITQGGTLVRTRISEVRVVGRATQGVTLIGLDEGDVLSGVQKVMVSIDEDELDDSVDGDTPITSAETSSETPPETPTE